MFSVEAVLVAAVGVAQGFLGVPTILLARKMGEFVTEVWSEYHVPITEAVAIIFSILLFGAIHLTICIATIRNLTNDGPLLDAWAIGFFVGVLLYPLIPAIEVRLRRR